MTMKNNIIIKIFSSIRTAVILFVVIAASSSIGTLLPQLKDYAFYSKYFPEYVDHIYYFSLNDVYHSNWFIALIGFLALNTAVCTARRFRANMISAGKTHIEAGGDFISTFKNIRVFKVEKPGEYSEPVSRIISKAGYKYYYSDKPGEKYHHGVKGRYSFLGDLLIHISLLMIFAGAMTGNIYSFKKPVECYPGDIVEVPAEAHFALQKRIDQLVERSIVTKKDTSREIAELKIRQRSMPRKQFDLRIDDFRTEYFKNESTSEVFVKNWYTTISALDGTAAVYTKNISVNDPIYHDGISVYQMNYGKGNGGFRDFKFIINDNGRASVITIPAAGYEVSVKDAGVAVKLLRFEPDLAFDIKSDGTREYYSPSRTPDNPAAELEISRGAAGPKSKLWVILKSPGPDQGVEGISGLEIRFLDFTVEKKEFTGLLISYDPGVDLVWLGSALMMLGFFIAVNYYNRRVWVVVDELRGTITVCGMSNKNHLRFSDEFGELCAALETEFACNDGNPVRRQR